eukprot:XP_001700662.1 predicted protein [Chlamydomonas reinhardtii]
MPAPCLPPFLPTCPHKPRRLPMPCTDAYECNMPAPCLPPFLPTCPHKPRRLPMPCTDAHECSAGW